MGAMSLAAADRRRFGRTRCSLPVELRTPLVRCGGLVARDISFDGLAVEPGAGVSPVSFMALLGRWPTLTVRLALPGGMARVRARLAWAGPVREAGRSGWQAGLQFTRVGPQARAAIRAFLRDRAIRTMLETYQDPRSKNLRAPAGVLR